MKFQLTRSEEFVILEDGDVPICYIAISPSSSRNTMVDGLYLYHGCKHDQIDTDEEGYLKVVGVDMI